MFLGVLLRPPHILPLPCYQISFTNYLITLSCQALLTWSSIVATALQWCISNDMAYYYKLCGIINTDNVNNSKPDPIL